MASSSSLPCKLIAQVTFKAGGDLFYRICIANPQHFSIITPGKIQQCDLIEGILGTTGSIIEWKYILDGKQHTAKHVLHDIDEEKKHASYKYVGGELLELYKNLVVTLQIETDNGVDYVTWTIDYELANPENPHPILLLQFLFEVVEDTEKHIFG